VFAHLVTGLQVRNKTASTTNQNEDAADTELMMEINLLTALVNNFRQLVDDHINTLD